MGESPILEAQIQPHTEQTKLELVTLGIIIIIIMIIIIELYLTRVKHMKECH